MIKIWRLLFISALVLSASAWSQPRSFPDRYDAQIRESARKWWPWPEWQWWKAQLYQESRLDPAARSPVGARGLAQFMPGTWADMQRQLGIPAGVPPNHARWAIDAGAFYMARLRAQWSAPRPDMPDRHALAAASYNAGLGNILAAQSACGDPAGYEAIMTCLPCVTGQNSAETIEYWRRIVRWRRMMR